MTIQDITTCKEYQTFDCKSIQINPKGLQLSIRETGSRWDLYI